jgi:hypothetical protein
MFSSSFAFAASGEGELHMKFTSPYASGDYVIHFSKAGSRTEGGMGGRVGTVALVKNDNPDVVYTLNDAARTYTELNRKELAQHHSTETYTVKKAGSDVIAGYKGEHVIVTSGKSGVVEMWLNKDLYELAKQFRANGPGLDSEGLMKALKDAGVVGVPIKVVSSAPGQDTNGKFEMALVSVERKPQPASLFEIPADYKKQDAAHSAAGAMTPEMRQAIQEQMKNLTPEQRAQIQKAMGGQE